MFLTDLNSTAPFLNRVWSELNSRLQVVWGLVTHACTIGYLSEFRGSVTKSRVF